MRESETGTALGPVYPDQRGRVHGLVEGEGPLAILKKNIRSTHAAEHDCGGGQGMRKEGRKEGEGK